MEVLEEKIDFSKFTVVDGIVSASEKKSLINFFNDISIHVEDITSEIDKQNNQKVVQVKYCFYDKEFTTKPLYYKNILNAPNVKDASNLIRYFEEDVFWLDIEYHDWPKPKGQTDVDNLIINDMTDDDNFKKHLKLFGNNLNMGNIQRITKEGRSNQYYRNLENNNHWHDLILLIKEYIKSDGEDVNKKFFKHLVFKWDGNKNTDRLRSSLSPYFGSRALIEKLKENIKLHKSKDLLKYEKMRPIIDLLKYKKQIILQGPPGTGKTKFAKEIAEKLIGGDIKLDRIPEIIDSKIIKEKCIEGIEILSARDGIKYKIGKTTAVGIEVIATSGKPYIPKFDEIIEKYQNKVWENEGNLKGGNDSYSAAIAKYIYKIFEEGYNANLDDQFKLLQFHPSYTYEDFVRGIVSKPNEDGDGIVYEAENKVLGAFAKKALENFLKTSTEEAVSDLKSYFENFKSVILESIDEKGKFDLSDNVYIFYADDKRYKYKGDNWTAHPNGLNMNFDQILKIIDLNLLSRQEIVKCELLNSLTRQHATYYQNFVELYREFINKNPRVSSVTRLKNYVLIIDEINRANLSSVLGELIYALEYRGESVESMYAVDGESKLILPPNLYIIGTMNTADRSVGHIDYAIRRRFAFVDVLPKDLSEEKGVVFDKVLFEKVAELFETYLSSEFEKKDVQLGHSYFIDKSKEGGSIDIRLEYEIKPILREYVKDGILKESALSVIEELGK